MAKQVEQVDDWGSESGLPSDFDGWIAKGAGFLEETTNYGEKVKFSMELDCDPDEIENGTLEVKVNVGGADKWHVVGVGDSVRHVGDGEGKRPKKYNNMSHMGALIDRMVSLAGDDIKSRGSAKVAETFEGTGWHWEREEYEIRDDNGAAQKRDRLMPTAFLGIRQPDGTVTPPSKRAGKGAGKGAKSAGEASAGATSKAPSAPAVEAPTDLAELAAVVRSEGGDADALVERALTEGVAIPSELMGQLDAILAAAG